MSTPNAATAHAPASTFVPATLDGSSWPALEPYYSQLIGRTIHDAASLERFLLDRSELDAAADEAAANLFVEMTRPTDDDPVRNRYLQVVELVVLDRCIAREPSADHERVDAPRIHAE